jgi:hypothetical protein
MIIGIRLKRYIETKADNEWDMAASMEMEF